MVKRGFTALIKKMDKNLIKQNLNEFIKWTKEYCKGDEKSEAQKFQLKFFECFGIPAEKLDFEMRVKFQTDLKKSTKFADCLIHNTVLVEMKSRKVNLIHHYNQLFEYYFRIPKEIRPKYSILCNFDEFWIFDFNQFADLPMQKIALKDLAESFSLNALGFLFGWQARFEVNIEKITQEAVDEVKELYTRLKNRQKINKLGNEEIQRFVLQCVFCFFWEDVDPSVNNFFLDILEECERAPSFATSIIQKLFLQMNNSNSSVDPLFSRIKYFNGGLFAEVSEIPLHSTDLDLMVQISKKDWKPVRPSIFGTIFESIMDSAERHASGAHYTSEADIRRVVNPTIVKYWNCKIKECNDKPRELKKLLNEIREYKVLDPACGSGNFLFVAYLELKRIEQEIYERIYELTGKHEPRLLAVSPKQFYGIDIKPFAVELAKLTLEIARQIAIIQYNLHDEEPLPLQNLDKNIIRADSLFAEWPETDAIIGNPPFLGGKKLREELGNEYIDKLYKTFSEIKGQPDFCIHWFRKAHAQKRAERIGFVGTNSITQGQSREVSLKYILENGGIIHDAIPTQEWTGEANVHVSIVNWKKESPSAYAVPLKGMNSKEENQNSPFRGLGGFYLYEKPVSSINSSLKDENDFTQAKRLKQNKNKSFESVHLGGKGFIISEEKAKEWIKRDKKNERVLKAMIDGKGLIDFQPKLNWIIDFDNMSFDEASKYKLPFSHIKDHVKPERDKLHENNSTSKRRKTFWWQYSFNSTNMREALKGLNGYFALPKIAKYTNFRYVDISILPCEANMVITSDDYYILGVLTSKLHRDWVKVQCSTLEDRIRYTNTTCFETFPFLWEAKEKLKEPVREIMKKLDQFRLETMKEYNYGITKLYNDFFTEPASTTSQLHRELDKAVCKVYGWKYEENKNYNQELFELNQELAIM